MDRGPWGWENSRAKLAGKRQVGTVEIGCYTDLSHDRMDPVKVGPYTVLMPWSLREFGVKPNLPRLGLVMRADQHLEGYPDEYIDPDWEQLEPRNYHGAVAWEELAALVSLALGLRLRAGGIMRVFGPGIDHSASHMKWIRPLIFPGLPGTGPYCRA